MKKKKICLIILMIVIILTLSGIITYFYIKHEKLVNSIEYKLEKIGYQEEEIKILKENVNNDLLNQILEYNYFNNLDDLVTNDNYQEQYFSDYLKSLENNKTLDEIWIDFNEQVINLRKEKYYLENNLNRYLDYSKKYPDKDYSEVIRSINSNIDNNFYTNIINTDTSKGYLMLVNKYHKLDKSYKAELVTLASKYGGGQLEKVAAENFKKMCDAASSDGIKLYNVSGYRSYNSQLSIYNRYVNRDGVSKADTYSARAGHSEHQTGLATDINTASSSANFQNTKEYAWLTENCYKYGFILRYPNGKQYLTGYKYEPWHYRYVGVEAATYIKEHNITFEEYYAYYVNKD